MTRIYLPSRGPEDWRRFLAQPLTQWRAGYSAMSAAWSWERAGCNLPPEIATLLGADAKLLLAIPEHKVPLPGGRRDSQCDVFALVATGSGLLALAVEAKVDEPFGPCIGDWLAQGRGEGRRTRLAAITALIGCKPPPADLRYQLFHRTAAAIVEARRFLAPRAAMAVQSFSAQHRWHEDFQAFAAHLGTGARRGVPDSLTLPDGMHLTLGWASCAPFGPEDAPPGTASIPPAV